MTTHGANATTPSPRVFRLGSCLVDLSAYTANDEVLTEQEVALLQQLYSADGKPVTRLDLYREVWGYRVEPRGRALDFAVRRLRPKLGDNSRSPRFLITVRGVGYKLNGAEAVGLPVPQVISLPVIVPPPPSRPSPLQTMRPPNRFIGRAGEQDELRELLEDGVRLLNLIGPGGVGKTRLAVEFLMDTSWTVQTADLSEVAPEDSPLAVIAAALELDTDSPTTDDLVHAASRLDVDILLIDRCEHVTTALAPILTALIQSSSLIIVTTSRHRLGVTGEVLFDVAPLPPADAATLLIERTRSVRRRMRVQATDPVIRRIVQRVDGLPMAIELTAARLRASTPHQIERRLRESLTVLHTGHTDSLLHTIQWSWDLLSAAHQRALGALHLIGSVIPPEQAEAVLAPLGDPHTLLEALVDRSWLQPSVDEPFRYRLLAPAMEWLGQHAPPPSEDVVVAFVTLYTTIVRTPSAFRPRPQTLARAMEFALSIQHPGLSELAVAATRRVSLGRELNALTERLDEVQATLPVPSARIEFQLAWRLINNGQHDRAHARLSQRFDAASLDPAQQAEYRWILARIYKNAGRLDDSVQEALAGRQDAEEAEAWIIGAGISSLLVEIWCQKGDLNAAMDAGRDALSITDRVASSTDRAARSRSVASTTANRLAPLYLMDGDIPTARRLMEEHLVRQREIGRSVRVHSAIATLALLEVMTGETERCESLITDAKTLETTEAIYFSKIQLRIVCTYLHLLRDQIEAARHAAKEAVALAQGQDVQAQVVALIAEGIVDLYDNKTSSAAARKALQICEESGLRLIGCQAAGIAAWLAARRGTDPKALIARATKAEELASFDGIADEQVTAHAGAAVAYAAAGEATEAHRALQRATELDHTLAHLVIIGKIVPMARAEIQKLTR